MNYEEKDLIEAFKLQNQPAEVQKVMLDKFYTTLNTRLAMRMADELSQEQLEQFSALADRNDDSASDWLMQNVPQYEQVMQDEIKQAVENIQMMMKSFTD